MGSQLSRRLVYAEQKTGTLFDEKRHKRYNATAYLAREGGPGGGGGALPMRLPIPEHPRSLSREAYANFISALEAVNLQPPVRGQTATPSTPEGLATLRRRVHSELGVGEKTLTGSNWTASQLARWERDLALRHNAVRARSFRDRLKLRAKRLKTEADQDPVTMQSVRWGACSRPPLRIATARFLMQPPSPGWGWGQLLLLLVALVALASSLVGQLWAISSQCTASYLCPAGRPRGLPVAAPPWRYRAAGAVPEGARTYGMRFGGWSVWPVKEASCVGGTAGCRTPGWVVQWPYVELGSGDVGADPTIAGKCPPRRAGEDGWAWDPFRRRLIGEYFDCGGEGSHVPFVSLQDMHFDWAYYEMNRHVTVECMKEVQDDLDASGKSFADYWGGLILAGTDEYAVAHDYLAACMDEAGAKLANLATMCDCGSEDWYQWPYNEYFAPMQGLSPYWATPDGAAKVCQGGKRAVSLCRNDGVCAGKKCEQQFGSQQSAQLHPRYGCLFNAPDAQAINTPTVRVCGTSADVTDWYKVLRHMILSPGRAAAPPWSEHQRAVWSFEFGNLSLAAVLFALFCAKEGGFITAAVVCGFFLAVEYGLWGPFFLCRLCLPAGRLQRRWLSCDQWVRRGLIRPHIWLLWRTLASVSSLHRICGILWSLARMKIKPRPDVDTLLAPIANLAFTVCLIFAKGGLPPLLSMAWSDLVLAASLGLTLADLLLTVHAGVTALAKVVSGFKDLNENRLSKFEAALLLARTIEVLVRRDPCFTWVEQMVGPPDFSPDMQETDPVHKDALAGVPEDYLGTAAFVAPSYLSDVLASNPPKDNVRRALAAEHSRERMPLAHAGKFGHDGLGQYRYAHLSARMQGRYTSQLAFNEVARKNLAKASSSFAATQRRVAGTGDLPSEGKWIEMSKYEDLTVRYRELLTKHRAVSSSPPPTPESWMQPPSPDTLRTRDIELTQATFLSSVAARQPGGWAAASQGKEEYRQPPYVDVQSTFVNVNGHDGDDDDMPVMPMRAKLPHLSRKQQEDRKAFDLDISLELDKRRTRRTSVDSSGGLTLQLPPAPPKRRTSPAPTGVV